MIVADGLAGDGARFEQTWVLKDGHPSSSYVSAVGFYGDRVRLGHGSKGGWDIFGIERRVTRAQSNVLYELDGRPALQPYKEYLGERTAGLPATALFFPLALGVGAASHKSIVRTAPAVDEADQSMTFAGNVPEGSLQRRVVSAARQGHGHFRVELTQKRLPHPFAETHPVLLDV